MRLSATNEVVEFSARHAVAAMAEVAKRLQLPASLSMASNIPGCFGPQVQASSGQDSNWVCAV